jgi:kynurenine formamidase
MKFRTFAIGYAVAMLLFVLAQRAPVSVRDQGFRRSVDLTQVVEVSLDATAYKKSGGLRDLPAAATQIEAPAKLVPGLWTVNQIPAVRLHAPLVVFNVVHSVAANPNYQIGVEDIARWEQQHGPIPLGAVVVAHTGWEPSHDLRGQARTGRSGNGQPTFSADATHFLVESRVVLGLGSDEPRQIVPPAARDYASRHSVYQLINVANLASVPQSGSLLVVAPEMVPGSVENRAHLTAMTE